MALPPQAGALVDVRSQACNGSMLAAAGPIDRNSRSSYGQLSIRIRAKPVLFYLTFLDKKNEQDNTTKQRDQPNPIPPAAMPSVVGPFVRIVGPATKEEMQLTLRLPILEGLACGDNRPPKSKLPGMCSRADHQSLRADRAYTNYPFHVPVAIGS